MVAGLSISCVFLVLGVRQLGHQAAAPKQQASQTGPAAPAAPTVLALATAGRTITPVMILTRAGTATGNPTIATPAEVIGKVALRPIPLGAPIDRAMIDTESKLAIRVPTGMRAMSIDTTAEIAVAGLVRPGDRVDVQVIYPGEDAINGARGQGRSHGETLLQMVPVLAVGDLVIGTPPAAPADGSGNSSVAAAPPPQPARTVTLALTPEQVSTLSLAKNIGGLYLSLRNPTDQVVTAMAVATPHKASPLPTARPARSASAAPARRRAPAGRPIELVIGGRSEIMQSGSAAQ
jgi:pilus assembly protein CpaB